MERKTPRYIKIDGRRYPVSYTPENVKSALKYKPQPNDIFVCTYPKCGTNWMVQIILGIVRNGEPYEDYADHLTFSHFLQMVGGDEVTNMSNPRCFRVHLPYEMTPYSNEAKYIFVARNPKDCCVSFYYHTKLFPMYYFSDGTFDDFFECFIRGEVESNDYFDTLLSWYAHRNDDNVLFVTFEAMKADHRGTVRKVAEFLGDEYSSAIKADEKLLDKIVRLSSFQYMKNNYNALFRNLIDNSSQFMNDPDTPSGIRHWAKSNHDAMAEGHVSVGKFVRCGSIGQAETVFSADQEERFQEWIREKTKGSDIMLLWRNLR